MKLCGLGLSGFIRVHHHLATKVFIGKLLATRGVLVIIANDERGDIGQQNNCKTLKALCHNISGDCY